MDLGKSVVIKGELSASEDLTLYGQMEGSVRLPDHTLTIGPQADIKADISAKTVVIMGAVTGNVTAGENVEIRATGSVTGDIVSPRLVGNTVVVMGAVTGNVTAGEKVEIQATGSVTGDIVSPRLVVADGGRIRGRVEMSQARSGQQDRAIVGGPAAV